MTNVKDVLEVLPRPENRVVLSLQKDALGIPMLIVPVMC